MLDELDPDTARALLEWQLEMGADEAIGDVPVDRFAAAEPDARPASDAPAPATAAGPAQEAEPDPVAVARAAVAGAADLAALEAALGAFAHCELKKGARHTVFADGNPQARVMIIGEAPGREEDRAGLPFVGRAGQLLDRMFVAIGMARDAPDPARALYITNILPWRPPQNRKPERAEIAMLMPFMERHVALAAPDIIVLMGNTPCAGILGREGITRLRGQWMRALERPVLPMFHPAYLLRNPAAKREAWADLLALQDQLGSPA